VRCGIVRALALLHIRCGRHGGSVLHGPLAWVEMTNGLIVTRCMLAPSRAAAAALLEQVGLARG